MTWLHYQGLLQKTWKQAFVTSFPGVRVWFIQDFVLFRIWLKTGITVHQYFHVKHISNHCHHCKFIPFKLSNSKSNSVSSSSSLVSMTIRRDLTNHFSASCWSPLSWQNLPNSSWDLACKNKSSLERGKFYKIKENNLKIRNHNSWMKIHHLMNKHC